MTSLPLLTRSSARAALVAALVAIAASGARAQTFTWNSYTSLAAVRAVCAAVFKPVNFMVGLKGKSFTLAELEDCGVRRISFATSLYRAAMSGLLAAAREIKENGTYGYIERTVTTLELYDFMRI